MPDPNELNDSPENRQSQDSSIEETQPRKRLRRLLDGSGENEAALNHFLAENGQPESAADNLPAENLADAAEKLPVENLPEDPFATRPNVVSRLPAVDNLPEELPVEQPEGQQPEDPFATRPNVANWLPGAEELPDAAENVPEESPDGLPDEQPADPFATRPNAANQAGFSPRLSDSQRHPTGMPESTAGWYGLTENEDGAPGSLDQTIPSPRPSYTPGPDAPAFPTGFTTPPPEDYSPPRSQSSRAVPPPPPLADDTMHMPRRVEEVDPDATRVTPAAYQSRHSSDQPTVARPSSRRSYTPDPGQTRASRPVTGYGSQPPAPPTYSRSVGVPPHPAQGGAGKPPKKGWKRNLGCAVRVLIALLFIVIFLVVAAGSWLVFQYFAIARDLPPVESLRDRASQFETTRILDRNGDVLYEILDPNAGRRTYVPLEKISPNLIAATIATEDREYYNHPGFDPVAIARAFYQNYTSGEVVSGASTITQQLARMLLLPDQRFEQTYERKAREIVLAAEITRRYSKDEILELYLNEANYGNLAYGIEAAAETYFNTTADKLTLGQASFLAGLPQLPAVYDIYTNPEATLRRHKQVVLLMYEASEAKGCIEVSNSEQPICVDAPAATAAVREIDNYNFQPPVNNMRYPHWVTYIRSVLEEAYDPQTIYRSGFTVYTTLDPTLQDQAQAAIAQQVAALADHNAHNGALVAIRPGTGEILAMVGSPNFNDEQHSGQVNMAISPRQPGSSIKPLTYAAAFEKGWTPATLLWDVPTDFPPSGDPNDPRPPYQPVNYDGRFHGPVTVRTALANSYNIPAVLALQHIGIYGQGGLIEFARRLGIDTLDRDDYGLSLTLGGGEVTLLDMTSAFATFANNGKRIPPVAITKITDYQGNVVYEYKPDPGQQVVRPEHAYMISSILSDNEARTPMFGANSVLNLPFQAAVKTGTTNDFRDNWTVGYTPDLAVGVWIGNADYTEMRDVTGLTGAAPAWSNFMQFAVPLVSNNNPTPFSRPPGIVDKVVCALSGTEPSEFCPQQRNEIFASNQPPLPKEDDLWKKVRVDTWTGLIASAECPDYDEEKFVLNVKDKNGARWIKDTDEGRAWAERIGFPWPITFVPERECRASDPRPTIIFAGLTDNQTITHSPLDLYAIVHATDRFRQWRLEWGPGDNPAEWQVLVENNPNQYVNPERVYTWDLQEVPAGQVTLRIVMDSVDEDQHAERKIRLNLQVPTPTPTLTPTVTVTPTPTQTLVPTATFTPTNT
ncbi:MAG: hypothetical protein GX491_07450, partial [Chloroflexi bacterium]|nr:hypothetical protein [Chloroflexota bacterium]